MNARPPGLAQLIQRGPTTAGPGDHPQARHPFVGLPPDKPHVISLRHRHMRTQAVTHPDHRGSPTIGTGRGCSFCSSVQRSATRCAAVTGSPAEQKAYRRRRARPDCWPVHAVNPPGGSSTSPRWRRLWPRIPITPFASFSVTSPLRAGTRGRLPPDSLQVVSGAGHECDGDDLWHLIGAQLPHTPSQILESFGGGRHQQQPLAGVLDLSSPPVGRLDRRDDLSPAASRCSTTAEQIRLASSRLLAVTRTSMQSAAFLITLTF